MKKADLLHTTILIVAILSGYSALQYAINLLSSLAYTGAHLLPAETLLYNLLLALLFSAACILLVRNSRKYAAALLKEEDETPGENSLEWQLELRNFIFVLFIGLGLYTLIQSVPYVFAELFELFRDRISFDRFKRDPAVKVNLIVELLRVTIGAFLVYAAPLLTNFIDKKIVVRLDSASQYR